MQLFPVKLQSVRPADEPGKDISLFGLGEDGFDYAVKTQSDHIKLPASEYFCYRLAAACRIAVPAHAILRLPNSDEEAFGSRLEGGLSPIHNDTHLDVLARIKSCSGTMSGIFAMDLFVGNEDRHFGNFLYRTNKSNELACMPIDYSRAWMVGGWPPRVIGPTACTTKTQMEILRAAKLWHSSQALTVLSIINGIQTLVVDRWLEEMPAAWLLPNDRAVLHQWWQSEDFHQRISNCIEFCK